jgi:pantoate--beta-alanine ligase
MKVIEDMRAWRMVRRAVGDTIGFVPTMGALHDGHASLLRQSVAQNALTVLSIYVNPTQFNDPDDLANYPSTLDQDLVVAEAEGVDYVILPRYDDLYSDGFRYQVVENDFSSELCGSNRPGHFTGVLTVVMKLLNLVRPQRAYFGKKDYQQYELVRDMVEAFCMDMEIVGCETVRECDGLAMSSRNKLLNANARRLAGKFNKALASVESDATVEDLLTQIGMHVDYIETRGRQRFGAVVVEGGEKPVRLIDNMKVAR